MVRPHCIRHAAWYAAIAMASTGGACRDGGEAPPPVESPRAVATVERESVTIDGRTFSLEVANEPHERERGLMFRETIDPAGGMVFVFPFVSLREFWMGWCLTDIDIIFIDPNGRVTATHQMKVEKAQRTDETEEAYRARLPSYPSRLPAQFVIELAGGTLDSVSVAFGDRIDMDWLRLSAGAR